MFTHTPHEVEPGPEGHPAWPFGFGTKPSLIGSRLVGGPAGNHPRRDRDDRHGSVAGIRSRPPRFRVSRESHSPHGPQPSQTAVLAEFHGPGFPSQIRHLTDVLHCNLHETCSAK